MQLFAQPALVLAQKAQIVRHDVPVGDDGVGQLLLLPNRRIGEDGDGTVGFQDGKLDRFHGEDPLLPQMTGQLIQIHPGPAEVFLQKPPVFHKDHRLAAEQPPGPDAFEAEAGVYLEISSADFKLSGRMRSWKKEDKICLLNTDSCEGIDISINNIKYVVKTYIKVFLNLVFLQ